MVQRGKYAERTDVVYVKIGILLFVRFCSNSANSLWQSSKYQQFYVRLSAFFAISDFMSLNKNLEKSVLFKNSLPRKITLQVNKLH